MALPPLRDVSSPPSGVRAKTAPAGTPGSGRRGLSSAHSYDLASEDTSTGAPTGSFVASPPTMQKPPYVRKTGIAAEAARIQDVKEEVAEEKAPPCPENFAAMLHPQSDGVTVGASFPRKASPITRFEESFILGPRHA